MVDSFVLGDTVGDACYIPELPKLARMMEDDKNLKKLLPLVKRQEDHLDKCWQEMVAQNVKLEHKVDDLRFKSETEGFRAELHELLKQHTISQN